MFKLLNKNIYFQLALFISLLGYSIYAIFSHAILLTAENPPLLAQLFYHILVGKEHLIQFSCIFIFIIQLILIQLFFKRSNFSEETSLYPSIIYLALSSVLNLNIYLSVISLVIVLFLIILLFNIDYSAETIKKRVFISGLLIGVSFLIDKSSVLSLLFITISLIVNRFSRTKDVLVAVFGFVIVLIYAVAYYLFTDNIDQLPLLFNFDHFFAFFRISEPLLVKDIVGIIFAFLLGCYCMISLRMIYSGKLIVMRRRLFTLNISALIMVLILLLSEVMYPISLQYIIVLFAMYYAMIIQYKRNWLLHDILILFTIFLLWL